MLKLIFHFKNIYVLNPFKHLSHLSASLFAFYAEVQSALRQWHQAFINLFINSTNESGRYADKERLIFTFMCITFAVFDHFFVDFYVFYI